MRYIEGFVIAVPNANKDSFIEHSQRIDPLFIAHGALGVVEGWGTDLPTGSVTDFYRAVQAREDEAVVFSWILWPDKQTRDAAWPKIEADGQMMAEPMPFDGRRMIFGGFEAVVELAA